MRKRQVKSPKIYLRDSGILHALLQIGSHSQLTSHPKLGASWEGFALEQVVSLLEAREAYFWATHGGAELDLLTMIGGKRYGFEFKYQDAPRYSKSMGIAQNDLQLDRLWVIYPGDKFYALDASTEVIPLRSLPVLADELRMSA